MTPPSLLAPCCCVLLLSPVVRVIFALLSPVITPSLTCVAASLLSLLCHPVVPDVIVAPLPCVTFGILLSLFSFTVVTLLYSVAIVSLLSLCHHSAIPSVTTPLSHVAIVIVPLFVLCHHCHPVFTLLSHGTLAFIPVVPCCFCCCPPIIQFAVITVLPRTSCCPL